MAGPELGAGCSGERHLVDAASTRPNQRRIVAWATATVGAALVAVVVAVAGGAGPPPTIPFLVFVALLAVSTNRDVVFPAEYAASADLAVVAASVVAFRHDGALLGPVLLGLLAGPLDVMQWRRRAFVRMAWNAGDRALAALLAVGAFAGVTHLAGESVVALVGAAFAAALAAVVVDTLLSLVLVTALGGTLRTAWRAVADIDALQLPLVCAGAASGFLAAAVGWWAVVPPMLAVVLVPELVQARAGAPARLVRDGLLVLEVVVAALVVVPFAAVPGPLTVVGLLVVAVAVGAELVADRRVPVPVVTGVAVVGAVLAVAGGDRIFAGLLVGAGVTAASWGCSRPTAAPGDRLRAPVAVALAALAGAVAGGLLDVDRTREMSTFATGVGAVGAALAFGALALVAAGAPDRRTEAMRLVWTAPVLALVVGLAVGVPGARPAALVLAAPVVIAATAWCGATPWRSRIASRHGATIRGRGRVVVLELAAVAGVAGAIVAWLAHGGGRDAAAVVTVGAGELATAMAFTAVHQWRLAPRARARDAALLVGAAVVVAVAGVGAARGEWWSIGAVVLAAIVAVVVGRPVVARSDALGAELAETARA